MLRKPRLYSDKRLRLPRPSVSEDDGEFEVKTLEMADSRFFVVRHLRQRVDQMITECGAEDSLAKTMLAHRACFLNAYCESCEVDLLNRVKIDFSSYLASVRALSDTLKKLGLSKDGTAGARSIEEIVLEAANQNRNGSKRRKKQ